MNMNEIQQELQPVAAETAQAAEAGTAAIDAGVAAVKDVPQAVENVAETAAADTEAAVTDVADDVEGDVEGVAETAAADTQAATASTESVCVRLEQTFLHGEQNVVRHAGDILTVAVETAERWIKEGKALLHTLETKIV